MKWAKGDEVKPASARGSVARLIDVAPTLLARAGAPVPDAMQGLDLAQDYRARAEKDRLAFSEEDHEGNVLRAVRTTDWKLIEANAENPRGLPTEELFHVAEDAGETRNVVGENDSVANRLRSQAEAQQTYARSVAAGDGHAATLSAAQEDALRALGYVE